MKQGLTAICDRPEVGGYIAMDKAKQTFCQWNALNTKTVYRLFKTSVSSSA